jgi:aromatic ring-cleaving dioxygenase
LILNLSHLLILKMPKLTVEELNNMFLQNKRVKPGTWQDKENHKTYAIWLGEKLNYKNMEDWYKITQKDIHSNHGCGLLGTYYNNSSLQFLKSVFPQERWLPWKFTVTANNIWKDKQNHKDYAIWLGEKLNYKNMEDWYKITAKDIHSNHGCGLLHNYYNNSPLQFLKSVFPQERWLPWKFTMAPMNTWENKENHKTYAIWLGEKLNYKKMEDWNKITLKDIHSNHGRGLLNNYYNDSPLQFLKSVFPQERWLPWKFTMTAKNTWKDKQNHKAYAIWLGEKLNYKNMEDWYKITQKDISSNYGGGLLVTYYNGSPSQFLQSVFPDYPWELSKFKKNYSQGQIEWLNYLSLEKYPDIRHILNHDDGEYSIPNSLYHADGYSEATNTVFEYHGDMFHGNPAIYEKEAINPLSKITYGELYEKTLEKQRFCEESGYKYVFIWESEWLERKQVLLNCKENGRNPDCNCS